MMVEGEAQECAEADLIEALQIAHDAIRIQIKAQEELRNKKGVTTKRDYKKPEENDEIKNKVEAFAKDKNLRIQQRSFTKA